MSRRCCCICPDAQIATFAGQNGTDINDDWDETNGDSHMLDGTIELEAIADSLITWQTPPGAPRISFHIVVATGPEDPFDYFRIVVNEVDEQNYFFAQWKINNGAGVLSLWKRTGGVNELLAENDVGIPPDTEKGDANLTVCFTPHVFSVSFGGSRADHKLWIVDPDYFVNGFLAGLGGTGTTARWAQFEWREHWYSNIACPRCRCYCGIRPLPMKMLATLGVTGGNPNVVTCGDGYWTELNFAQGLGHDEWQGQVILDPLGNEPNSCGKCSEIGFGDHTLELALLCQNGDVPVGGFLLDIDNDPFGLWGAGENTSVGDSCDPLVIVFAGRQSCGEPPQTGISDYTWTITIP